MTEVAACLADSNDFGMGRRVVNRSYPVIATADYFAIFYHNCSEGSASSIPHTFESEANGFEHKPPVILHDLI